MVFPPLSVIIPTWNTQRYLPAGIAALRSQLHPDDEIILVDNGSHQHRAAVWAQTFAPDIRLVVLPTNRGFAGGTNAGLRSAHNDLLLLCNDDALVLPGCLDTLRTTLRLSDGIGMVAGVLTNSHHPTLVASAGISMQRDGVAMDYARDLPSTLLPPTPQEIFGPSGGLALYHRALLDDVGLFAEHFFAYLEDADLAWRARLRGWRCLLAPTAHAMHVCSASGSTLKQRLLARNRLRVIIRCLPTPLLREYLPAIIGYDVLAMLYAYLVGVPDVAAGRFAALHELPMLWAERQTIQARRTASCAELSRWIAPPSTLQQLLGAAKATNPMRG